MGSDAGGPPLPPDDRLWRHPSEFEQPAAPTRRRALLMAGGAGFTLAVVAVWALGTFDDNGSDAPGVETAMLPTTADIEDAEAGLSADGTVIDAVEPSLVSVHADGLTGTGLVFREDGHVLTSAALLGDAASVSVRTRAGSTHSADVIGRDDLTDTAVLHVAGLTAPEAEFGSSDALAAGDPVVVVTVSAAAMPEAVAGMVAAGTMSGHGATGELHGLMGTDVELAGAGGVVINADGAAVGLTAATDSDVALAVPVETLQRVSEDILVLGHANHPWLGVQGDSADGADPGGVIVRQVHVDSPAESAGLAPDDVITRVEGDPVHSIGDLVAALRRFRPGDTVHIDYRRNDRDLDCEAELVPWP